MVRLLSKGSKGLDVNELQAALNFHVRSPAIPLMPDGDFGNLTDARLREFQRRAGIDVDGVVGPQTVAALYRSVRGIVENVATPRRLESPVGFRGGAPGTAPRAALFGGLPGVRQLGPPVIPDFIPPSQRAPQARTAVSQQSAVESKLLFNPLSDPADGEHPFRLTLIPTLPWPVFLPAPLELELTPYFFVGAGMNQNHFKDLNVGASAKVKVKLLENIGGSGVSVGVEADGGAKFNWERETGKSMFKGFFEGGAVLEGRF